MLRDKVVVLLPLINSEGYGGTERSSKLPRLTQLASGRTRTQMQLDFKAWALNHSGFAKIMLSIQYVFTTPAIPIPVLYLIHLST